MIILINLLFELGLTPNYSFILIMDKIVPNPAATIVNYIKNKCNLPPDQIEKKLLNGESFEMIKG